MQIIEKMVESPLSAEEHLTLIQNSTEEEVKPILHGAMTEIVAVLAKYKIHSTFIVLGHPHKDGENPDLYAMATEMFTAGCGHCGVDTVNNAIELLFTETSQQRVFLHLADIVMKRINDLDFVKQYSEKAGQA